MESMSRLLSWQAVAATASVYLVTLAIYRLFFHPLSKFPGPKLAAITRYYEAYYDIIHNGQYGFEIAKMHKKYGPIIRISPYELHIKDSAYFEKLYRHDGRWDKYSWAINGHNAHGAIIFTADNDQHKVRRQPLNAYFSKARIADRQTLIQTKVGRLCERIAQFADTGKAIDLGAATSAFQRDISTKVVLNKDYGDLEKDDFGVGMTLFMQGGGKMWRLTKHIRWYGPAMLSIPKDFLIKNADANTANFMRYAKASEEETERLLNAANSSTFDEPEKHGPSIVHEIVRSNLPPEDKIAKRVFADVTTVTGAGFETTASVLRLVIYHIYSNPSILRRLRAEVDAATISASSTTGKLELRTLEQLPYLTSVLMEAMRFSPAVGTRLQRIAPDRDLFYNSWAIPAGTPVGMTTLFMHMDENLYPDPERFEPERWVDPEARKKFEKVYAPFSRGSRICLGMHLAWANMYLVLSALVQRFDFDFQGLKADHFQFVSDQFIIGTKGQAVLEALVTPRKM